MNETPAWKRDFPVSWTDDHFVTRREFTKSLVLVSSAACAANGALVGLAYLEKRTAGAGPPEPKRIASAKEIPEGGSIVFDFPEKGNPCLLVRIDPERFVAFGQKCTHLGCPVLFRPKERRLYCPCHEGFFDAADGRVLAGPPPRPLPRVELERRGDDLWAIGIDRR